MKKRFYFVLARYFKLWASLQLKRWRPKVFVVTGSSGKTTTLHLVEAQLGAKARYSHHANSAFGICFDILGLGRKKLKKSEWIGLILRAPVRAFKKPFVEQIYIAEVDCDRPEEGKFLADLLRPTGIIWLSSTHTHAASFDRLVEAGQYKSVDQAIAHEFGWLLEYTTGFAIVNTDNIGIKNQLNRTSAELVQLSGKDIKKYSPSLGKTSFEFVVDDKRYAVSAPALLPEAVGLSVLAVATLVGKIGDGLDRDFSRFVLPPGRSSVFTGIKKITLIDSTYNASLDAAVEMIHLLELLDVPTKWLVVSDVLEQGSSERRNHEQLAMTIAGARVDKIIVMGPRMIKYAVPTLEQQRVEFTALETPKEVLDVLKDQIQGGETILFKGTRFLEGVVEHLLANPADAAKLCRREAVWHKRRTAWGL